MSVQHHGSNEKGPDITTLNRMLAELEGTARREFPNGRLGGDDDGSLTFAVSTDHKLGIIKVLFTRPTQWLGLRPCDVDALCESLQTAATEIRVNQ